MIRVDEGRKIDVVVMDLLVQCAGSPDMFRTAWGIGVGYLWPRNVCNLIVYVASSRDNVEVSGTLRLIASVYHTHEKKTKHQR